MSSTVGVSKARASYTVAFICALELEMSAVRCMFDVSHPSLPPEPDDSNLYILGELSGHNVVLAWLSGYQGKGAAAIVATNLSRSFPAIQWRFLVGIGGGVPSSEHDIRLGDVVISMPEGRYGGIVQYDLGKDGEEEFQLKGHLLAPPTQLRNAVLLMRSNHSIAGNKVQEFVGQMLQRFPRLSRYRRPPSEDDVLFAVDCLHSGANSTCGGCDMEKVIGRDAREFDGPEIHYGLVASGDRVIKSAAKRQATAQNLGDVLCFEMEAAGIATEYPCVAIRGISDYADSHKNDQWQCYAAAAAAAATKELLSCVPVGAHVQQARETESSREPFVPEVNLNAGLDRIALQHVKDCAKSLAFAQMNDRINDLKIKAAEGTCGWLLRHEVYVNWSTQDRALLWIKGKPGSGKSTLLRWCLDEKKRRRDVQAGNKSLILSFFFHGRGVELEKTPLGLFRSLLHQLLSQVPEANLELVRLFQERCDHIGEPGESWQWRLRELQDAFRSAISLVLTHRIVWLFVDAVDECGKPHAIELVRHLRQLLAEISPASFQFLICVTCRHYPMLDQGSAFEIAVEGENENDISAYVQDRLSLLDTKYVSKITDIITSRADGIFMWASFQIDRVLELELDGVSLAKIEAEILSTPRGLYSIYEELVQSMRERPKSQKLMQWICFARWPLSLDELRWVLAVDADHKSSIKSLEQAQDSDEYIANSEKMELRLKSLSCGLVEAVWSLDRRVAQFIHQSVRDFFVETGISALSDSHTTCKTNSNSAIGISHHQISRTCVRYVHMSKITQPDAHPDTLKARFPLLYYAASHGLYHAKEAETHGVAQSDLLIYLDWPSSKLVRAWRRICWQMYVSPHLERSTWTSILHMLSQYCLITPLEVVLSRANQKYVKVNERDVAQSTALMRATGDGCVAVVELLLGAHGIEINARGVLGRTALIYAVLGGGVAVTKLLLDKDGVDVNARDDSGQTALSYAVSTGQATVVTLLLETGHFDINERWLQGQTALLYAVWHGQVAVVRLLLDEENVDINARDDQGQTALSCAVCREHVVIVGLLLDKDDIEVNVKDADGRTPLAHATRQEHVAIVELLLDHHLVDLDAKDEEGLTPLLYAARKNYQRISALLLATKRADMSVKNESGRTPLSYAAQRGHVAAIKAYASDHKELIDLTDANGKTPLWYAASAGQLEAAELLIQNGANVAAANDGGEGTPLHIAATYGLTDIIELLIKNRADVGAATGDGITPLHAASSLGQADAIKLLIKNQARVEARDATGRTPLHMAICSGNLESVNVLLGAGADPQAADWAGLTPQQLAFEETVLVRPSVALRQQFGAEDWLWLNGLLYCPLKHSSAPYGRGIEELLDDGAKTEIQDGAG
ncbi:hypothetical protein LLEC1_05252 [Akanthomyces lecanii]|uniref:Uncharacterized protein n=1 Tax=Cordyceps confragosa TaxID=2714763 RepID=A0A179I851_CORDF|nr:hypothetical protein LLEC1_05252 [Akanthomyces lecanii]